MTRDRRPRGPPSSTPHSSARVAAYAAWRSATPRSSVGTLTPSSMPKDDRTMKSDAVSRTTVLEADEVGAGPRLVLAHGFTPNGPLLGGHGRRPRGRPPTGAGRPSRSRRLRRSGCPTSQPVPTCWSAAGGAAATSASLDGCPFLASHAALAHPETVSSLVPLVSGTTGLDDPLERPRPSHGRRRAGRPARSGVGRHSPGQRRALPPPVARTTDVRRPRRAWPRRVQRAPATRRRASPRAFVRGHRNPATPLGPSR